MATLDDFLRETVRVVKERFPDAGILVIAVEDADEEQELTWMTNMPADEVRAVVKEIDGEEDPFEGISGSVH